jgi:hypothetical protein
MILLIEETDTAESILKILEEQMKQEPKFFTAAFTAITYAAAEVPLLEKRFSELVAATKQALTTGKLGGIAKIKDEVLGESPRIYRIGFASGNYRIVAAAKKVLRNYIDGIEEGPEGITIRVRAQSDTHFAGLCISVGLTLE